MTTGNEDGSSTPSSLRWWFEDRRTGRVVVAQAPNALLWIFIACWTGGKVFQADDAVGRTLSGVASASLALWSLDEIVRGVNPWRRTLGAGVLMAELISLIRRHA